MLNQQNDRVAYDAVMGQQQSWGPHAFPSTAGCLSRKLISIVLRLAWLKAGGGGRMTLVRPRTSGTRQEVSNKSAICFELAMRAASATVRTNLGVLAFSDALRGHCRSSGLVWGESMTDNIPRWSSCLQGIGGLHTLYHPTSRPAPPACGMIGRYGSRQAEQVLVV